MIPLNKAQLQILKERLRIMRHDVRALLEAQRERRGQITAGRVNVKDAETLLLIEAALQRHESGHFGFCTDCDKRIAMRLLVENPCAVYCKNCAKGREPAAGKAQKPGSGRA